MTTDWTWSSYSRTWSGAVDSIFRCAKEVAKATPGIARWMALRSRVPGILEKEEAPLPETATLAEREAAAAKAKAAKASKLRDAALHYIGRSDTTALRDEPGMLPELPESDSSTAAAAVPIVGATGRRRGPGSRRGSVSNAAAAADAADAATTGAGAMPNAAPGNSSVIVNVGAEHFRARLRGSVEFRDVFFGYPQGEVDDGEDGGKGKGGKGGKAKTPAAVAAAASGAGAGAGAGAGTVMCLKGLSFKIEAGSQVAIVGKSGCGKTTIFRLIARLYDATSGEVLIDGRPIASYNVRSLRRCLGYIEQGAIIFEGRTVRENICYGLSPGSAIYPSDADIELACRRAACWDDVCAWPKGLDTKLGEWLADVEPSGGQKQRLVIARAIVRDPCMMLFDESTAALDSHAEGTIKASIESAMQGRTRLVIAHRLATVVSSDLILVVDEGRVVESGTHSELRKNV